MKDKNVKSLEFDLATVIKIIVVTFMFTGTVCGFQYQLYNIQKDIKVKDIELIKIRLDVTQNKRQIDSLNTLIFLSNKERELRKEDYKQNNKIHVHR
jgi:hypothetical protein